MSQIESVIIDLTEINSKLLHICKYLNKGESYDIFNVGLIAIVCPVVLL